MSALLSTCNLGLEPRWLVRQGRGISGVLELAEHLGVREDLARVATAELEEPAQERGPIDAGQEQDVAEIVVSISESLM